MVSTSTYHVSNELEGNPLNTVLTFVPIFSILYWNGWSNYVIAFLEVVLSSFQ
jgi:hypothetical protein